MQPSSSNGRHTSNIRHRFAGTCSLCGRTGCRTFPSTWELRVCHNRITKKGYGHLLPAVIVAVLAASGGGHTLDGITGKVPRSNYNHAFPPKGGSTWILGPRSGLAGPRRTRLAAGGGRRPRPRRRPCAPPPSSSRAGQEGRGARLWRTASLGGPRAAGQRAQVAGQLART